MRSTAPALHQGHRGARTFLEAQLAPLLCALSMATEAGRIRMTSPLLMPLIAIGVPPHEVMFEAERGYTCSHTESAADRATTPGVITASHSGWQQSGK
jgi:hypothetical protein